MIFPLVTRFAAGLRFPTLFKLAALLFVVNLFVPDLVPFIDEILMAVVTVLLASWKRRRAGEVIDGTTPASGNVLR